MTPLTIGAWNVRTLLGRSATKRSEIRISLIARELARYNLHIVALNETRFVLRRNYGEKKQYTHSSGQDARKRRKSNLTLVLPSNIL